MTALLASRLGEPPRSTVDPKPAAGRHAMTIPALSRREIRPSRALALWKGAALSAEGAACYAPLQLVLCDAAHQDAGQSHSLGLRNDVVQRPPRSDAPEGQVLILTGNTRERCIRSAGWFSSLRARPGDYRIALESSRNGAFNGAAFARHGESSESVWTERIFPSPRRDRGFFSRAVRPPRKTP